MTLSEWLDDQEISDATFAERIGVTRQALHRYKTGKRTPRTNIIRKITAETLGQVRADDFVLTGEDYETGAGA